MDEFSLTGDAARQEGDNAVSPRSMLGRALVTKRRLIAHSIHTKGVVVTHESARRPDAKAARIPDVCHAFKVPCIDTYEMLDRFGADFRPGGQKKR